MTTITTSNSTASQTFGGNAVRRGDFSRPANMLMPTEATNAMDRNQAEMGRSYDQYLKDNRSWLHRLFPTATDKLLKDYELQRVKGECDYTCRILALGYEAKYQACHEEMEAWLQTMKVETRTRVASFLAAQYGVLVAQIHQHRIDFEVTIRERYVQLERSADIPVLQNTLQRSMENEIIKTVEWLDSLLDGFRQIHIERLLVQVPAR